MRGRMRTQEKLVIDELGIGFDKKTKTRSYLLEMRYKSDRADEETEFVLEITPERVALSLDEQSALLGTEEEQKELYKVFDSIVSGKEYRGKLIKYGAATGTYVIASVPLSLLYPVKVVLDSTLFCILQQSFKDLYRKYNERKEVYTDLVEQGYLGIEGQSLRERDIENLRNDIYRFMEETGLAEKITTYLEDVLKQKTTEHKDPEDNADALTPDIYEPGTPTAQIPAV